MRSITDVNEIHSILLGIAREFHKICVDNGIPYYMLGGTMLGAIRHKGFIPWDDDMDFGVPRPYYERLLALLNKDLPYPYRCCTYKNNSGVYAAILKIDDCRTVIEDPCVRLPLSKQIGVNIDVFPLDYCQPDDGKVKKIHRMLYLYQTIYVGNLTGIKWKNIIKKLLSVIWPISKNKMLDRMHDELAHIEEGEILANVFGAWKEKECVPIEWYGTGTNYSFEDIELCGIKEFDKYLKQLYGDYMIPPKGDRHIHLNNVFWRD